MRKRLISSPQQGPFHPDRDWLDLERLAVVEVSSEDPEHPIEEALLSRSERGWRASGQGPQTIRILFDEPQTLHRIRLVFVESAAPRTQEFVLRWSGDRAQSFREIVRQQWNFSPDGATREVEDYGVAITGVTALELFINPNIASGNAVATLAQWRLA
jgi:XRCC1 N terminal domain